MTQRDINEMASECGLIVTPPIEAFAKLVEAKVESRYMQLFLDPENQPTQFGTATQEYREQEIKKEREALLDIVYGYAHSLSWNEDFQADIRARGEA